MEQDLPIELIGARGTFSLEWVEKEQAFEVWQAHVAAFPSTGLWPMLTSPNVVLNPPELEEGEAATPSEVSADADEVDVEQFFAARKEELELVDEDDEVAEGYAEAWGDFDAAELPEAEELDLQSALLHDFEDEDEDDEDEDDEEEAEDEEEEFGQVAIVLVPVKNPTDVFTQLTFGDWNDCPGDAEITAVLRRWNAGYGAVPFSFTSDAIELFLTKPVMDANDAKTLAFEQAYFASDVVDQGTETVANLAESLLGNPIWFFWWD